MSTDPRNSPSSEAQRSQNFAKKLIGLLKGKRTKTWKGEDSHWELIIGFFFFFGGLYFLFDFLSGV